MTVIFVFKIRIGDFIQSYRRKIKPLILNAELEAAGFKIELVTSATAYKGKRHSWNVKYLLEGFWSIGMMYLYKRNLQETACIPLLKNNSPAGGSN